MGAIAPHKTATSEKSWDGPTMKANLKLDAGEVYYRSAFAWQDPEGDPKTKAAYKFIHHEVSSDGTVGAANLSGCLAGIAVLNGARGGTTIPTTGRAGVYAHLAAHMRDGKQDPPPLRDEAPREVERRELQEAQLTTDGADGALIGGYTAVFNRETVIGGLFREVIRPGAFKRAIAEGQDVVAWYQHGKGSPLPLGRTTATPPTLRLAEDEHGLRHEIDPPATQSADELRAAIKRGDVKGMSFAFEVSSRDGERWDDSEVRTGKLPLRELLDVDLFDVSPVVFPAYQGTSLHARSAEDVLKEHRETAPAGLEPETPQQPTDSGPNEAELELDRKARELSIL